jgi:hypothetical protein
MKAKKKNITIPTKEIKAYRRNGKPYLKRKLNLAKKFLKINV